MGENKVVPRNEPEIMRAKGRLYVAHNNKVARKPYGEAIHIALELAEQAYRAHGLRYETGLNSMDKYPPDRFTWICAEKGDAKKCVQVRDDRTGRVVTWADWTGEANAR
jgi:hypothetical protein